MNQLLYFVLIAATMMGLSKLLPGFHVTGWTAAILASVVLAFVNAVVKPILFILTLPFTIATLGLFLFVLNAMMLKLTDLILGPGFEIQGIPALLLGSIALAAVGMAWKGITQDDKKREA